MGVTSVACARAFATIATAAAGALVVFVTGVGGAASKSPQPPLHDATLDSLQQVGTFGFSSSGFLVFGDANHDGRNELILRSLTPENNDLTQVFETQTLGQYDLVAEFPGVMPLALGDIDQDGRADLVAGRGQGVAVYESPSETEYPLNLVWQSPPISAYEGVASIADTDGDGLYEIVYQTFWDVTHVLIFECTGDNQYVERYRSPSLSPQYDLQSRAPVRIASALQPHGLLVCDLFGDHQLEIAICWHQLRMFRATGNNQWSEFITEPTGLINTTIFAGGEDTDGDGRREVWVAGDHDASFTRRVYIYEPKGELALTRVDSLITSDGRSGLQTGALTQLYYDGVWRFAWALYKRLDVYTRGPGGWQRELTLPTSSPFRHYIYAGDLNRNGRDELYWVSDGRLDSSFILECPTQTVDVPSPSRSDVLPIQITPSPVRTEAFARVAGVLPDAVQAWTVFDAAGRVVSRGEIAPGTTQWALPQRLAAGAYFLRVDDQAGGVLATGRFVVVR